MPLSSGDDDDRQTGGDPTQRAWGSCRDAFSPRRVWGGSETGAVLGGGLVVYHAAVIVMQMHGTVAPDARSGVYCVFLCVPTMSPFSLDLRRFDPVFLFSIDGPVRL